MKILALMAISLALIAGGALAQTVSQRKSASTKSSDRTVVYGVGASSCGAWLDAREGAKKNKNDVRHIQFESYLDGFASAYNWYVDDAPSAKGVLGEMDVYGQRSYLDKYCRDNPTHAFVAAANELLVHLKSLQR
jgi:hypothetical protein